MDKGSGPMLWNGWFVVAVLAAAFLYIVAPEVTHNLAWSLATH
jgi:hypothetical protein